MMNSINTSFSVRRKTIRGLKIELVNSSACLLRYSTGMQSYSTSMQRVSTGMQRYSTSMQSISTSMQRRGKNRGEQGDGNINFIRKNMNIKDLKEKYKTPLAEVREVFLCESVAVGCQSPVKRVTLEDWEEGDAQPAGDGEISLPLW
jgi:hypothetical protein